MPKTGLTKKVENGENKKDRLRMKLQDEIGRYLKEKNLDWSGAKKHSSEIKTDGELNYRKVRKFNWYSR